MQARGVVQKDFDKAKAVLKEAIERDPTNAQLHMQLVDVAYQKSEIDESGLIEAFDIALSSDMNEDEKLIFAQRKLEFLEDFGTDPFKIQEAFEEYYRYSKSAAAITKKRQLESASNDLIAKKAKLDVNGTGEAMDQGMVMDSSQQNAMQAGQDMAYNYAQQWANYPQAYNYQQAWGAYQQQYYQSHG